MAMTMVGEFDEVSGRWIKSYTVAGQSYKTRSGSLWNNLETRTNGNSKYSCYDNSVNGFASFQEFAEWCNSTHGYLFKESNNKFWQLDKDILVEGNNVYSPETCCFVPNKVNSLLIKQPSKVNELPTGVSLNTRGDRYVARCRDVDGKRLHIGVYQCPEETHSAWLEHKRRVVKEVLILYDLAPNVIDAISQRWDI